MRRKKKKKARLWAQEASAAAERKGTKGSFRAYCLRKGYSKVTAACIAEGKRSSSPLIRKRAVLAENYAKIRRKRRR